MLTCGLLALKPQAPRAVDIVVNTMRFTRHSSVHAGDNHFKNLLCT